MLAILGLMIAVAAAVVPRLTERARLGTTEVTIESVKEALVSFTATNWRLPCPDTSATPNGLEGNGGVSSCATADTVGLVPYRALGLSDPVLDEARLPLRYAVYRNPTATADLATLSNRFISVLSGNPPTNGDPFTNPSGGINTTRVTTAHSNDLDFCLALRNAKAAASVTLVRTLDGANTPNAAFALVSGGVEDADGDGADLAFDGVNEGVGVDFESPARRRGAGYDDLVFAMPFDLLESRLSCAAITIGVAAAANVAIAAAHMVVQAEDSKWGADLAVEMGAVADAQSVIAVAMGAIDVSVATNDEILAAAGCTAALPICSAESLAIAAKALADVSGLASIATVVLTALAKTEAVRVASEALARIQPALDYASKTLTDAQNADLRAGQQ